MQLQSQLKQDRIYEKPLILKCQQFVNGENKALGIK